MRNMNETVVNLDEISYSRELFEAKPKPFVTMFIYMLLLFFLVALGYSYFGEIEVVTTGSGLVRPNENIATIVSEVQGEVAESIVRDGLYVEKGQVLCVIRNEEADIQKMFYENRQLKLSEELEGLKTLKSSIEKGYSQFTAVDEKSTEFSTRYDQYIANAKYIEYTSHSKVLQLSISDDIVSVNKSREELEHHNTKLKELKNQIRSGETITQSSHEAQKYNDSLVKLVNVYTDSKENLETKKVLYDAGIISEIDYRTALTSFRDVELEYEQYNKNYVLELEELIKANKTGIQTYEDLQRRAKVVGESILNEQDNLEVLLLKHKSDTLVSINTQINALIDEIDLTEKALENALVTLDKATMRASSSGWLDAKSSIEVGNFLIAGQEIARIVPDTEAEFTVELFIQSNDISEISVGQEVVHKVAVAESTNEFKGSVVSISPDIRVVEGHSGFLVRANLDTDDDDVVSNTKSSVKVGQSCETSIIIAKEKVIVWLYNKLSS